MNRLAPDRCYACRTHPLQPPLIRAYPEGRRTRDCPQCGISVAGDRPCPQCRMGPSLAYQLELLLRRRRRALLLKAACAFVVLAALLAGWARKADAARGVPDPPPTGAYRSSSPYLLTPSLLPSHSEESRR